MPDVTVKSIDDMEVRLDNRITNLSDTVADNVKEHFEPQIQSLRDNVNDIDERLDKLENSVTDRLRAMDEKLDEYIQCVVSEPFNPHTSVIIFGLPSAKGENMKEKVSKLFTDTLQVGVNVVHA